MRKSISYIRYLRMAISTEEGTPTLPDMTKSAYPAHLNQSGVSLTSGMTNARMMPIGTIATAYANHLICWRSTPIARRSRTNSNEAARVNRGGAIMYQTVG